ncbi:hypothetical protein AMECASPLE_006793 [Ameca splendens]|uniref:Secreted protein n=1 Tax=Ameca splendens TaxID=208324 RepID=A0ABV0ZVY9_9TELE
MFACPMELYVLVSSSPCQKRLRAAAGFITIWSQEEGDTAVLSPCTPTHQPTKHNQTRTHSHTHKKKKNFTPRLNPRSYSTTNMDTHANTHAGTARSIQK